MTGSALADHLRSLGASLSVAPSGKVRVEAPIGVLTDELRSAIREHRDELLAMARAHTTPAPFVPTDPRPDLTDDADDWRRLLALAWQRDGTDRCGVYAALLGMRCLGVHLISGPGTLRLQPRTEDPGDPPRWVTPAQYPQERADWLDRHREALVALLGAAVESGAGAPRHQ